MNDRMRNIALLLLTVSFVASTLALITIASNPGASGYELSIYDEYPGYFWAAIALASISASSVVVIDAFFRQSGRLWVLGICGMMLVEVILFNLQLFRGYALGDLQDSKFHLAWAKGILDTGNLNAQDFYPALHILTASLSFVSFIRLEVLVALISTAMRILMVVGMYLLATTIANTRRVALISTALIAAPIFWFPFLYIHPSGLSMVFVPFSLFAYERRSTHGASTAFTIVLIVTGMTVVLFHPLTTLFLVLFFAVSSALEVHRSRHQRLEANGHRLQESFRKSANIALMVFVSFVLWFSSFALFQRAVQNLGQGVFSDTRDSVLSYYAGLLGRSGLTAYDQFVLFINRYGAVALLLLGALVASLTALGRKANRRGTQGRREFDYSVQLLFALVGSGTLLALQLVESDVLRIVRMAVFLAIIVLGLQLGRLSRTHSDRDHHFTREGVVPLVVASLLVSATTLGILGYYPSPRVAVPNYQVTNMEIAVTQWLLSHDYDTPVIRSHILIDATQFYLLGYDCTDCRVLRVFFPIPNHFGYDMYQSVSDNPNLVGKLLLIGKLDTEFQLAYPPAVQQQVAQYTPTDLARLNADFGASKIYASNEFTIWAVG